MNNFHSNESDIENLLQVLNLAGKLKTTLRSSLVSQGRKESVADHSWRVALLVILVAPFLDKKINLEKAIKMAIIHDLAESVVGDINIIDTLNNQELNKEKLENEKKVFENIVSHLGTELGSELLLLWNEFEENSSYEAKVINALDKIEAQLQQNESKLSMWKEIEKTGKLQYLESFCDFDAFLKSFKDELITKRTL